MQQDKMRIGVDIGGTFTDLVAVDSNGGIVTTKTLSTPDDPSEGVAHGLLLLADRLGMTPSDMYANTELMIHGTTVATNTLAQRNGAHVGLLTTSGFRDVLELREGTKSGRYDLHSPFPQPLIRRPDRLEVIERLRHDGRVEVALDEAQVLRQIQALRKRGVEAVVVGLLHSHINPAHELRVRELIQQQDWQVYTVLSHEILGSEGEYDRFSTAAVNAYVGPRLDRYLGRLEARLREAGARFPLLIMQSTGGLLPALEAARYAVGCVTSGPAGGATATALYARLLGVHRVVAYDTGGTTTDISLIDEGKPQERRKTELEDIKIAVPSIDIQVVALGGGSIARLDAGGILTLGPDSAGAMPGPACYGRGGERVTLTDANLVLGYLSPTTFLGGRMKLDLERAKTVIREQLAEPLGLSVEAASLAVNALASSRIAAAVRTTALRRGLDPRELSLLSFGGAGGLHTAAVANELSIPNALVPREASVFSALGFLAADVRLDAQKPFGKLLPDISAEVLEATFQALESQLRDRMAAGNFDGATQERAEKGDKAGPAASAADVVQFKRFVDCRYRRQISTLELNVPEDVGARAPEDWILAPFEAKYRQYYGHVHANESPYIETCRVSAYRLIASGGTPQPSDHGAGDLPAPADFARTRRVFTGEWIDVPGLWFDELREGARIVGPALVESTTTTVFVPEGSVASIDPFGSLAIQQEQSA